jgi:L-threonylcarbamoyladenylate synthase
VGSRGRGGVASGGGGLGGATGGQARGAGHRPLETLEVDGDTPDAGILARAAEILAAGGLLIYPTDTLYALGGRALDAGAGPRVRIAKGREHGKALPLIAADVRQASGVVVWTAEAQRLADRFWPGPLTLVLAALPGVPPAITEGAASLAVRVPALRLARDLCLQAGPLISTSANRSGAAPPATCADAVAQVGHAADLALDAGAGSALPSTIVDVTGAAPRLLRPGAVAWTAVEAAWSGRGYP